MRTNDLFKFIKERHLIYIRRTHGDKKPWTTDPILQQYKFTNVYRELDTVTQWVGKYWRMPHRTDPQLWFAMVVARLVNWPATLVQLGYPVDWRPKQFVSRMHAIAEEGKAWGGAYIVSTNGNKMDKPVYIATRVLDPLWKDRAAITDVYQHCSRLQQLHQYLMRYDGLGSFLAAQVIADLKYVKPLCVAADWHTWAASGPGSRRGMNRVCSKPVSAPWKEQVWLEQAQKLRMDLNRLLQGMPNHPFPALHAQDVQNALCEFDKYERARLGEGRPKTLYPGAA